jgi:hypothetical protein
MIFNQKITATIFFVTVFFNSLSAGTGGSGYSRYGIGDLRYFNSSRMQGTGSLGLALLPSNSISRMNPAAWSNISRTRFSIGMLYEGFSANDNTASAYLSGMNFNGGAFAFPLAPSSGITLGLGLVPYSSINYHVIAPHSISGLQFTMEYIGEGGISVGFLGSSVRIGNDVHVGAKLNYYFGTMRHTVGQVFQDNSLNTNVENVRTIHTKGAGATVGCVYTGLGNMLHLDELSYLNFGIVLTTSATLSTSEEHLLTYKTSSLTTRDTVNKPERLLKIPASFGVGLVYGTGRYIFSTDIYYQPWNNFNGTGTILPTKRSNVRFGAGGELFPRRDAESFVERIAYRAGFFYNASYYRIRGQSINEIGFTIGFGLPVISDTRLNIGVEYSLRGTTASQLQKDKILRISFTLSGGEQWFYRPPEE